MAHKHENACPIPDDLCSAYKEQQRIIRLLKDWAETAVCYCCANDAAAAEIIDLIQGENK